MFLRRAVFTSFFLLTLAACGGGGGSGSTTSGDTDLSTGSTWQDQYGRVTVGANGSSYTPLFGESGSPVYVLKDNQGNNYRIRTETSTAPTGALLERRNKDGELELSIVLEKPNGDALFNPYSVAINEDGSKLFVTYRNSGTDQWMIASIDPFTGTNLNEAVYATGTGIGFSAWELRHDGGRVYLRYFGSGNIEVYDEDLNKLGTLFVSVPYPEYQIGSPGFGSPATFRQTFEVDGDILYSLIWPFDRGSMSIRAYDIVTDSFSGDLTAGTSTIKWTFDLPNCMNCENVSTSGPNVYGTNTELLQRAFPGFWVAENGNLYFPQMLYKDITFPTYSLNKIDLNGLSVDPDPLDTAFYVLETEDYVRDGDITYLVGNVAPIAPSSGSLFLDEQAFLMKLNGQTREWIKIVEAERFSGANSGKANFTHVRLDGNGGISVNGNGSGIIEGVEVPGSEFTVNYDADFLASYNPDPNVEAELERLLPSLEDTVIGYPWIYTPTRVVEARIFLGTDGTGTVRTYDSTGRIDGVFASFTWTKVDNTTLNFNYNRVLNCDFTRGVWVAGSAGPDQLTNITISEEGFKFNDVVYKRSTGNGNGNPQAGDACSRL